MRSEKYARYYSESAFSSKIAKFAQSVGSKGLYSGLTLFYCLKDDDTPAWVRTVIIGALGYFIFPFDVIPDFIPGAGMVDDLGAIAGALATAVSHIKPAHKKKAKEQMEKVFGKKAPVPTQKEDIEV